MQIACMSLNHRMTPLDVREDVAFQPEEIPDAIGRLRERLGVAEVLLLSTCHRTELYVVGPAATLTSGALVDALSELRAFEPRVCPPNHDHFEGEAAIRHLFRVAGGLDSQILGETEILGQIKRARDISRVTGGEGRVLARLVDRALRVGKRIRSETRIGEGALSHATAAIELARRIFGKLEGRRVLVVGAGEIAELALENLQGRGVAEVRIANRTREKADALAERFGATAFDLERIEDALAESDLVISSTAAKEPVVDVATMKRARARRRSPLPVLVVDLAMPRDFAPEISRLDDVFLKHLEDLDEIIRRNQEQRADEKPTAEAIVSGEVETFTQWLFRLELQPTIIELRDLFERIRSDEFDLIAKGLDDETRDTIEKWSRRLVGRLLHLPTENLKRHERLRDRETRSVLHDVLTQEVPHPRERDSRSTAQPFRVRRRSSSDRGDRS